MNKKASIPTTLTWFVAIFVIIFIMVIYLVGITFFVVKGKVSNDEFENKFGSGVSVFEIQRMINFLEDNEELISQWADDQDFEKTGSFDFNQDKVISLCFQKDQKSIFFDNNIQENKMRWIVWDVGTTCVTEGLSDTPTRGYFLSKGGSLVKVYYNEQ